MFPPPPSPKSEVSSSTPEGVEESSVGNAMPPSQIRKEANPEEGSLEKDPPKYLAKRIRFPCKNKGSPRNHDAWVWERTTGVLYLLGHDSH